VSLSSILGQERALQRLRSILTTRAVPPALLFHGPQGVGKATAALEFAKALNCEKRQDDSCPREGPCPSCAGADKGIDPDIRKVDAAYQASLLEQEEAKQRSIKIDTVRHLIRDLEMRSMLGRWKTAVLEDAHTLVPAAANAMLKTLEEPPSRTVWILVTHRPGELLATIRSRCHPVPFAPLAADVIMQGLLERGIARPEAEAAAPLAEGSLGRALQTLERAQPDPEEWLAAPLAPFELADALPTGLHLARPLVEDQLHRMEWHVRRSLGPRTYASAEARAVLRELSDLRRALRSNASPRLVLELAALRLQEFQTAGSPKPP